MGRGGVSRGSSGAAGRTAPSPLLRRPPLEKGRELGRPGQPLSGTRAPREAAVPRREPPGSVRVPESPRIPRTRPPVAGLPAPAPPARPEDPSQRVFRRIFPERTRPEIQQQTPNDAPGRTLARPGAARPPEELRPPQPRPGPRMEPPRTRPQPPKAAPPPRDRDKKKDKP